MLSAERHYEQRFRENHKKSLKLWKGEQFADGRSLDGQHKIVINFLRHIVETKVASSCFNPAEIITRPKSPLGSQNEEMAKRAVGYEYREAQAQRECKRAFKDSCMFGFGVVMTGWEFQIENQPEIEGRQTVEGETPAPADITAMVESGGQPGQPPVPAAKVLKDGAFCRRLDPRNFRVSPEACWVIEDAPYCGYVELREVAEVKADPRYKNTRGLKGSAENLLGYLSEDLQGTKEADLPADVRRVKLHHYFEKRRRLHLVFCDEHEKPLLTEEWYWEHERYPFRLVFGPRAEDEFYPDPTPIMEWEPMQKEINLTRSQLANVRQQMVPKWIGRKGDFSQQDQKRFRSGVVGTFIETTAQNPATAAASLPLPTLSPDFWQGDRLSMSDLGTISTLDQYGVGNAPTKRMTTTETQAVAGASGARREADRQAFEELCAGVAEDILDLLQQYADRARALPIYDDQQQVQGWQQFTKQQIQGDFDLEVYVGSTEIKDQKGRQDEIGFLLQSLFPYAQLQVFDPKPLIEQLLAVMPEIKNVQAIMHPPPPPAPPGMPPGGVPGLAGPGGPGGLPGLPPGPPGMNGGGPPGLDPALLAKLGGGMPPGGM